MTNKKFLKVVDRVFVILILVFFAVTAIRCSIKVVKYDKEQQVKELFTIK